MALNALRLRRALSGTSTFIGRHEYLRRLSTTTKSLSILQSMLSSSPQNPKSTFRPKIPCNCFHSSPFSLSSFRNFNDSEKIDPETILFEGCDYKHWLIVMDFPNDPTMRPPAEEMVEKYVQTLAKVVGSVEEAKKKMYACSTTTYTGFQAEMDEETAQKFEGMPGVIFVLPDSYVDPVNKEYGGDKYIDGTIIPRPPPVQYGRTRRPNRQIDQRPRDPIPNQQWNPDNNNNAMPQQNYGPPGQGERMPGRRDAYQGGGSNYMPPEQGNYNQGYNHPQGQMANRPGDHSGYAPQGQTGYRPGDRGGYAPQEQMGNRPGDHGGYAPQGQVGNRPGDHSGYAPQGQVGNRPGDHSGYTPQGQVGNRPGDHSGYTPQGQVENRPGDHGGYAPQGQVGNRSGDHGSYAPQGQVGNRQVDHGGYASLGHMGNRAVDHSGYAPQGQVGNRVGDNSGYAPLGHMGNRAVDHGGYAPQGQMGLRVGDHGGYAPQGPMGNRAGDNSGYAPQGQMGLAGDERNYSPPPRGAYGQTGVGSFDQGGGRQYGPGLGPGPSGTYGPGAGYGPTGQNQNFAELSDEQSNIKPAENTYLSPPSLTGTNHGRY